MDLISLKLAEWLGDLTGTAIGVFGIVWAYLFAWFMMWGLWTGLILSKAGFNHGPFWCLFLPLNVPILLLPIAVAIIRNPQVGELFLMFFAGSIWLGLVLTAVMPWPLRKTAKPKPKKLNLGVDA